MADVAVETDLHVLNEVFYNDIGPVWTDGDTGYVFFIDGAIDLYYRKTTDGGASWATAVLVETGTVGRLAIWFDKWTPGDSGTIIHMWWVDITTNDIMYRDLDVSDDSLGTERIVFDGASFDSGSDRASRVVSGTKAVGGNLYVQFWGDAAGERGFYRSIDSGVNWTSRTDGADGDAEDEVLCLPDGDSADNEDIVMIYWDRSADEISIKKYDNSGNSWGETSISTGMTDSIEIMQMSAIVRHSDGHIIVAAWNNIDSATLIDDLKVWDITLATPTITAKADVVTNTNDCVGVALFIDQNNDDLYCAYLGDEDGSQVYQATLTAFYKLSDDGGDTWGTQAAYQEDTEDDERYISAGHSTPGNAVGRFEPVFFNDDLLDLFVNKVNSVEITVAAGSKIKTVDTIAIASVKTISGIAIASVKTRDTISNV